MENMKKIKREITASERALRATSFLISPFLCQGNAKTPFGDFGGSGEKGLAVKQTGRDTLGA
jgi:hypothetical protein